jgi:3-oxoadipate enol-lactonase
MPLARINGIELYYEVHGEGPALVLAHGGGGSHLSWWQNVPVLARRFRCVTFDHRGFGASRELAEGPGPNAFVEDLRQLLDHLGIQRAALAGQSMGGWTVLGFAAAYPDRVSALMLCDTHGGMDDPEVIRELAKLRDLTKGSLANVLTRAYAADFPTRDPVRHFLYQQISGLNTHVPANLIPELLKLKTRFQPIVDWRIPTTLLVGAEDALIPPSVVEVMAHRIPQAHFIKVAGAGHSVYFEKPDDFNRMLTDFLTEAGVQ